MTLLLTRGDADTAEVEVKVIDFGLAKAIAEAGSEMDLTRGGFVGTPNFGKLTSASDPRVVQLGLKLVF